MPRVHARLDHFDGDLAANRLLLLGDEDQSHAPLADLLHQLICAYDRARTFADPRLSDRGGESKSRSSQEAARVLMGVKKHFQTLTQAWVTSTRLLQKGGSGAWRRGQGLIKESLLVHCRPPGRIPGPLFTQARK